MTLSYGTFNLSVTSLYLNHVRGSFPSLAMLQNMLIKKKKKSKSFLRHTISSHEGEKNKHVQFVMAL